MRQLMDRLSFPAIDIRLEHKTTFYLACLLGLWLRVAFKPTLLSSGWSLRFTILCSVLAVVALFTSLVQRTRRPNQRGKQ